MARNLNNVVLKKGSFITRNLDQDNKYEMEKVYRFRYEIFCKELKWLPSNNSGKESDGHDQYSVHFGIFSLNELVGYARIILSENSFMLEREFADLLDYNYCIRKQKNAIEISRLAIERELRRTRNGLKATMLLYKSMYQWSIKNKVRYWYMVVEINYLKALQVFFPCEPISAAKEYQPNIPSAAAFLDLRRAENFLSERDSSLYNWFVSEKESL